MGKRVSRVIFVIAIALSIGVAAPFHALAMAQPCAQMAAQMTKNAPVMAMMEQAGDMMPGDVKNGDVKNGDAGGNMANSRAGASMDCAQHCSDLGTASLLLSSKRQLTDTPPANGLPALILVFLEPDPSPPRPGTAA